MIIAFQLADLPKSPGRRGLAGQSLTLISAFALLCLLLTRTYGHPPARKGKKEESRKKAHSRDLKFLEFF